MTEGGEPFFYLGDTAWELFHRLSRSEAAYYLQERRRQGFTVIQAAALAEFGGLTEPNAYARLPIKEQSGCFSPTALDLDGPYSYWDHVDTVIQMAAEQNLVIALLPTWGDKFNQRWGQGPEIFTPETAYQYGKWLGERYRSQWNLIWVLGGDRPLETTVHHDIIDAMARGLREGDLGFHLITFHPMGASSSVDFVKDRDYIDFHMIQSGHGLECYDSWKMLRATGQAEAKPFLDGEPRYEDHPACFRPELGVLWNDSDVRQNLYWNLMEGACGNTYGNHSIWRFQTEPQPYWPFRWMDALLHPGAEQVRYGMQLRLSRPYFEFRPAPDLVQDDEASMAHIAAGRGDAYAFVYSPLGQPIRAHFHPLAGSVVRTSWFDPRNGISTPFAIVPASRETLFIPPTSGKGSDWVLIADAFNL